MAVESVLRPLAWALIQFLWQGSLVALVLGASLRLLRGHDPRLRYALSCLALLAMGFLPIVTVIAFEGPLPIANSGSATAAAEGPLETALPWIVGLWSMGVVFFGLRHFRAWWGVRDWSTHDCELPHSLQNRFDRLVERLGIARSVALIVTTRVDVPSTVGWLRPVVLVPASLLTGLPASQLDALLIHELAHVRRHDYLVNLVQVVVETMLFYHPAVWWVSRQIRIERESCCDDVAVAISENRRAYVEALTHLETMRGMTMTMSASGGSLLTRVRRLIEGRHPQSGASSMPALLAIAILMVALATGIYACDSPTQTNESSKEDTASTTGTFEVDHLELHDDSADGSIELHLENGQTIQVDRLEGMSDKEFHLKIKETLGEENVFFGDPDADLHWVHDEHAAGDALTKILVERGVVSEGDPAQVEFKDGSVLVNGLALDPDEAHEIKRAMHDHHKAMNRKVEFKEGWDFKFKEDPNK